MLSALLAGVQTPATDNCFPKELNMPAIPVHARIETHMNDDEVKALATLTGYLVRGFYEPGQSLFFTAAAGDMVTSGHMLTAVCAVHAAAMRTLRERNLTNLTV